MMAVRNRRSRMVDLLVEAGADVNERNLVSSAIC